MLEKAVVIATMHLEGRHPITRQDVESVADDIMRMQAYEHLDRGDLIRQIEYNFNITNEDPRFLENDETKLPWLNDEKSRIEWRFWHRYQDYIKTDSNFSPDSTGKLDYLTDRILDNLFNPKIQSLVVKKGLVVGQVQSGKTSNYIGLINKAADAGFNVIIVLAGIHNSLRSQTQLRVDTGFLGFDTLSVRATETNRNYIGVGRNPHSRNFCISHSMTSSQSSGDFRSNRIQSIGLNFLTSDPIIAVVKKNHKVLSELLGWMSNYATETESHGRVILDKNLLLIDDEADHASINTSANPQTSSRINGLIRDILNLYAKKAYVGYTATPFANIFIPIDQDDLFPKDFIINIPPPTNYIGPEQVFGYEPENEDDLNDQRSEALPLIRTIGDYDEFFPDRHKILDDLPVDLPVSLKEAIRCFIISCSVRVLRGDDHVHNSMLVHVTRFRRWQSHISELIRNVLKYYQLGIEQNDPQIRELMRQTYLKSEIGAESYPEVTGQMISRNENNVDPRIKEHQWEEVKRCLHTAAAKINVIEFHGNSRDTLCYYEHPKGLSAIVVGADKLSRGMTLEGLSICYFLRSSKMYDTLMQMGRWFGYRPGYADLCRLFISDELFNNFAYIAKASRELRDEFDVMTYKAGAKPIDYALKVRAHPGVLQISATNKLRSATYIYISHSGRLVESYAFIRSQGTVENNFKAYLNLTSKLRGSFKSTPRYMLWEDVDADIVLSFLRSYQAPDDIVSNSPDKLASFIEKQKRQNLLTKWRLGIMSKDTQKMSGVMIGGISYNIGHRVRKQSEKIKIEKRYHLRKSRIISPGDEFIDLTAEQYEQAMELTRQHNARFNIKKKVNYPKGSIVRANIRTFDTPLILLYLLDPEGSDATVADTDLPYVGYALSFPSERDYTPVQYAIQEQLLSRFDLDPDDIEEEADDDDED